MKIDKKKSLSKVLLVAVLVVAGVLFGVQPTQAAPQTFTVNSTGNGTDANTGDGICETSTPGECTFVAAVRQANENGNPADQDVIEFNIPGAGPHTIPVGYDSIFITQSLFINGYSEPGAVENTAANPEPMNGTLMIEIDGSDTSTGSGVLVVLSDSVEIRGLVMNRGKESQIAVENYQNVIVAGNYLATDITGMATSYNLDTGSGRALDIIRSKNLTIGGTEPEDRNVITGYDGFHVSNYDLPLGDPDIPTDITIQGNNFFVGADSVTPLPPQAEWASVTFRNAKNIIFGGDSAGQGNIVENTVASGVSFGNGVENVVVAGNRIVGNGPSSPSPGILINTFDDCCGGTAADTVKNVRIGGTSVASRNVISDSGGAGIQIVHGEDINVLGNYIGVADDGITPLGNGGIGVNVQESHNVVVGAVDGRNIISDNGSHGVWIDDSSQVTVGNNYIGLAADGITALANIYSGIFVNSSEDVSIGSPSGGNVVGANGSGIQAYYSSRITAQNNYIGIGADGTTSVPNDAAAVYIHDSQELLIGGTGMNEGNLIHNDTVVANNGVTVTSGSNDVSILGNSIYNNPNLGIDLDNNWVTPNDELDPDTGTNDLLNFPGIYDVSASGSDSDISYLLDVPAGDYRIEFFSNDTPDDSGNGQGQTFIGSQNVTSTGSGSQSFVATVSGNAHSNVFATTTEINPDTFSGFGPTSEFGDHVSPPPAYVDIGLTKVLTNPQDMAQSATLTYDFTYTNHGPDAYDLTQHGIPLATPQLLTDFVHPDLLPLNALGAGPVPDSYFIDVGNNDLTCLWGGSGSSALLLGETVNPEYGIVVCWYTGADTELPDNGEISLSIDFQVANDSQLAFSNYGFVPSVGVDPDASTLLDLFEDYPYDLLGVMRDPRAATVNNLAIARSSTDVGVTAQMVNPQDFAPGATIYYDVTLTNRGPAAVNIADYANMDMNLLTGAYFGQYLTLVGSTNPGILCGSAGPGSIAFWGLAAQDHQEYQLFACVDSGSGEVIAPGGTYTIRLQLTVGQNPPSTIGFYAANASVFGDPGALSLVYSIGTATGDILDTLENDNFAHVMLTYNADGDNNSNNGNSPDSSGSSGSGDLSSTGENIKIIALIAIVLLLLGSAASVAVLVRKKYTNAK